MAKRTILIILFLSIIIASPNVHSVEAWGSSRGSIDIEPGEWWYYPMIVDTNEHLTCTYQSDWGVVENFIVHADDYIAYSPINENKLLHHGISASESFSLTAPGDGDWYWVFVNIGSNTTRIHWEWEVEDPPTIFPQFDVGLVSLGFIGIAILALIIHLRMRAKNSA